MRKFTHEELLERQAAVKEANLPVSVVLNDIRSLYNVGSIFRTADGAGIEKLWICGITGFPPDGMISKTALGAEESVPWEYRRDVCGVVRELKSRGYRVLLVEQTPESAAFQDYQPSAPVCLVLGNEVSGISEELLSLCDDAVEIEMAGTKNSLNVAVAFGIVAYHLRNTLRKKAAL